MCLLPFTAAAVAAPRTPLRLFSRQLAAAMTTAQSLKSVDYEVFGNVQGVCFRMYTEGEAKKLGVVGWVKNTRQGTVTGQVQGPEERVNSITGPRKPSSNYSSSTKDVASPQGRSGKPPSQKNDEADVQNLANYMNSIRKSWLSKVGSPSSRIDRTNFSNEKAISKLEYTNFSIRY